MLYKMTMLNGKPIPTTPDTEIIVKTCPNFKGTATQGMFSLTETTAKYGGGMASYGKIVWFITEVKEVNGSFEVYQKESENPYPFKLTPIN